MPHRAATHLKNMADHACPLGLRLMAFACAQLLQAEAHLAHDGEELHTGIHEARKCLRRVRATLALGKRAFDGRAKRLDDDLGRLCRGMSRLRDAQALIEALRRLDSSAAEAVRHILPGAETAARHRRDRMLALALAKDPGFKARRRRMEDLRKRLVRLDWQAVDAKDIGKALARSERRAVKAGNRAEKHPGDDQAWHAYRRRLRRLRQQHNALSELGLVQWPINRDLDSRTESLGESQDDLLLLNHCRRHSPFPPKQRALLRATAKQRLLRMRGA